MPARAVRSRRRLVPSRLVAWDRSVSAAASTGLLILAGVIAVRATGDDRLFFAALTALAASVWVDRRSRTRG